MTTTPQQRRANVRLLVCLIIFALALCLTVLWWMRVKVRANGGRVDPTYSRQLAPKPQPALSVRNDGSAAVAG